MTGPGLLSPPRQGAFSGRGPQYGTPRRRPRPPAMRHGRVGREAHADRWHSPRQHPNDWLTAACPALPDPTARQAMDAGQGQTAAGATLAGRASGNSHTTGGQGQLHLHKPMEGQRAGSNVKKQ